MNKHTKTTTIVDAIQHKQLFGSLPAFSRLDTWGGLVRLKAVFALPMSDDELAICRQCTGKTEPPTNQPSEFYTIVGRRGEKSFISSLTAVFIGCFSSFKQYLNADETAAILILARDRDQAKMVFSYVSGILHVVAPLKAMIDVERADEIELDNGVIIMVKTSDFRVNLIRSFTYRRKSYGSCLVIGRCLSGCRTVRVLWQLSLGKRTTAKSGFLPHLSVKQ